MTIAETLVLLVAAGIVGGATCAAFVGAVRAKLEKNKRRTWGQPDADGVVEHTAEGDQ